MKLFERLYDCGNNSFSRLVHLETLVLEVRFYIIREPSRNLLRRAVTLSQVPRCLYLNACPVGARGESPSEVFYDTIIHDLGILGDLFWSCCVHVVELVPTLWVDVVV